MSMIINYLSNHPQIGVISGFSSGGLMFSMQAFFMDEQILKTVAACGVWIGFMIAIMTGIIKCVELLRLVLRYVRKKQ